MMPSTSNLDDESAMTHETEMTSPVESGEVGASLPSPEEIRTDVNPLPSNTRQRKGSVMLLVFVFAVVLLIGLSVGFAAGGGPNRKNNNSSTSPIDSTPPPEDGARKSTIRQVQDFVIAEGVSSLLDFSEVTTPQSKASHWMAQEDELNMVIPNKALPTYVYQFLTRYALAVLYYSSGGENWWFDFNFLSGRPTCQWNGQLQVDKTFTYLDYGVLCQSNIPNAIYLDNMMLSGSVPSEIAAITTLEVLDLSFNSGLGGFFPDSVCQLKSLTRLAMGYNNITGLLPDCINDLGNLQVLFLANSELSGPIPAMDKLENLSLLYLDDNNLSGDITTAFDNMPNLRYLILESNWFSGEVAADFLSQNTNLLVVDISDNEISGDMPLDLFGFENIETVDLSSNYLGGPMIDFPVSNTLQILALHNNLLSGPIPASIKNLRPLVHLDLSNNTLTEITDALGMIANLTYLFMGNNAFSAGPIPESFANLTKLQEFSIKYTGRNGTLPSFISTWKNAILVDLDGNNFEGDIPPEYGSLLSLQFLLLNNNKLTGSVPASFAALQSLRAAFFEDNDLVGNLTDMCSTGRFSPPPLGLDTNGMIFADCAGGAIQCDCCVCCDPNSSDGCDDHGLIASLELRWENTYKRTEFTFGNETRFTAGP